MITKYKTLLQNFSYLTILKALTLLLPLVTFPYLMRILGSEKYGLIMWAWAIAEIFIVFIKFGFDTLGVKLVSENRDNQQQLSYVFSKLTYIKLILLLIASIVFFCVFFFVSVISKYKLLFLYFYMFIFFESMLPIWYFQGIENMKIMAILVASIKLIFALLVFLCIKQQSDYIYVPILYGLGSMVSATLAYYLIIYKDKVFFTKVKFRDSYNELKEGGYLLFANFGTTARDRLTIILIERFLGLSVVAYFDISMKIINILLTPFHMVGQVLYPHIAKTKDIFLLRKIVFFTSLLALLIVFIFIYFVNDIAFLLNKNAVEEISRIMIILIFIIPIGNISNLITNCILVVFNCSKWLVLSVFMSLVVYALCFLNYYIFFGFSIIKFAFLILLFFITEMIVIIVKLKISDFHKEVIMLE